MSIIKSIKQVLGLGPAAESHHWDGSVPNQLSLKRGTPEAPGTEVLKVVDGAVSFPSIPYNTAAWARATAQGGAVNPVITVGGNIASITRTAAGNYSVSFATARPSGNTNYAPTITIGQLGVGVAIVGVSNLGFIFQTFVTADAGAALLDLAASQLINIVVAGEVI